MFFDGMRPVETVDTAADERFRFRRAGPVPALLLLHGHPQTHAAWHAVAPRLVRAGFDVICPDLPGYGGTLPHTWDDPASGTRDAMATRIVAFLAALGVDAVDVCGHDRGARVAERLAVGWPDRVRRLALIDVVPSLAPAERADMAFSLAAYRAFWFAQAHPKPESLIRTAPDAWREADAAAFHPEAVRDYLAAGHDADVAVRLNDAYRQATERDAVADRIAHAAGHRISCPLLVIWATRGVLGGWYDPLALWRGHAAGPVDGQVVEGGHFLPEDNPDAVARLLAGFFAPAAAIAG